MDKKCLCVGGRIVGAILAAIAFWSVVMLIGYTTRETYGEPDLDHDPHPILSMLHLAFTLLGLPVAVTTGAIVGGRFVRSLLR